MGGGEVHVADLVRGLANRGHAVYLAVRPESPLRAPLAGVIASWHELPLRNSLDLQSARAIAQLVVEHRIDIVHAHMGRDYLVAALACKQAPKAKLVLTRHHYLPLKRGALYRWMLSDVAAIIAVSDSVRDSVLERLRLPDDRVRTLPNWIDPDRFKPSDRDAARAIYRVRSNIVVACIGQIVRAKGQEEFVLDCGDYPEALPWLFDGYPLVYAGGRDVGSMEKRLYDYHAERHWEIKAFRGRGLSLCECRQAKNDH